MARSTVLQLKAAITELYENQKITPNTEVIIKLKTTHEETVEIRLDEIVLTSNNCLHSGTDITTVVINASFVG